MDEAGLFTLRFVITGLSTKKAAEICNTSESTYKKWESTRIYPISAIDLIKANAGKVKECEALSEEKEDDHEMHDKLSRLIKDHKKIVKLPGR
jgi:hypothetical protein